jgi:hypothetical protein
MKLQYIFNRIHFAFRKHKTELLHTHRMETMQPRHIPPGIFSGSLEEQEHVHQHHDGSCVRQSFCYRDMLEPAECWAPSLRALLTWLHLSPHSPHQHLPKEVQCSVGCSDMKMLVVTAGMERAELSPSFFLPHFIFLLLLPFFLQESFSIGPRSFYLPVSTWPRPALWSVALSSGVLQY